MARRVVIEARASGYTTRHQIVVNVAPSRSSVVVVQRLEANVMIVHYKGCPGAAAGDFANVS